MKAVKEVQVSFRIEENFADQLKAGAHREEVPLADFVRKLVRMVIPRYRQAGSLHVLKQTLGTKPKK